MEFLIVVVILAVVVFVLTGPLRAHGGLEAQAPEELAKTAQENELAELEAERDAKYREIRDADLDHRTGKLSDEDFEAIDRSLRTEAIEILHALDKAEGAQAG